MAQMLLWTNDIDAMDFADLFLEDEEQIDPDGLNELDTFSSTSARR